MTLITKSNNYMFTDNSTFTILFTNDLDATKKFYTSIGADHVEEEEYKVVYRVGSNELHFVTSKGVGVPEYNYNNSGQLGQGILIYIGTEDIVEAFKTIAKAKPNNMTKIKANDWESKEFLFEDNNGYKFVCYEDLLDF
jgi:predicted enzyme related to lactoylglutathione lyase